MKPKILIVKRDVSDDSKVVGNNAKFGDIAKVVIDVQLPDLRISRGMGKHGDSSQKDWFGNINEVVENDLEIIQKVLVETGDFGKHRGLY